MTASWLPVCSALCPLRSGNRTPYIWGINPFPFPNQMVSLSHRDGHMATQNPFLVIGTFSLVARLGRHIARSCWLFWFQTQGERCSEVIRLTGQDAEAGMRVRKSGRVIPAVFGLWLLSILTSPRCPCACFLEAQLVRFSLSYVSYPHMPPLHSLLFW